jgi:predicted nuclease with TOPRIM domain
MITLETVVARMMELETKYYELQAKYQELIHQHEELKLDKDELRTRWRVNVYDLK